MYYRIYSMTYFLEEAGHVDRNDIHNKTKLRFLQLHTSRLYNERRKELLRPTVETSFCMSTSSVDLKQYILSHRLVDDEISKKAEAVSIDCPKGDKEGVLGRSELRIQTAVIRVRINNSRIHDVATDSDGNAYVVVMLSPYRILNRHDATEYLKWISENVTSTSISFVDGSIIKLTYEPDQFHRFHISTGKAVKDKTSVSDQTTSGTLSIADIGCGTLGSEMKNIDNNEIELGLEVTSVSYAVSIFLTNDKSAGKT